MKTRQLTVRPFREDDLEALFQLLSDPEVMRYLEPPFSREQTADFLHSAGICDPPLIYAVEDAAGEFVGYVIYHPYGRDCYEIGWVLAREQWHKGYAQQLTQAMIRDAKGKTSQLVIECLPEQTATSHLALKNGFTFQGRCDGCDVYSKKL